MASHIAETGAKPRWPVWATMLASVAVALLANLYLAIANRGQFTEVSQVPLSPPGYVIGAVWVALFALMGAAYGTLRRAVPENSPPRTMLLVLIALCALYPVYTDRLRSAGAGLIGVVVVLGVNTSLLARLWRAARTSAWLLLPLQLWLLFAMYLILAGMRLEMK